MRRKRQRGFTLIEAIISMATVSLIVPSLAVALQFLIEIPASESATLSVSRDVNYAAEWISNDANQAEFFDPVEEGEQGYGTTYGTFSWTDEAGKVHTVTYFHANQELYRQEKVDGDVKSTFIVATGVMEYTDICLSKSDVDSCTVKLEIECTQYDGGNPTSKKATFYLTLRTGLFSSLTIDQGLWPYRVPITIDNSENSSTLTDYQIPVTFDTESFPYYGHLASSDGDDLRFYAEYDVYPETGEVPVKITGSDSILTDYPVRLEISTYGLLKNIASDGRDLRFYVNQSPDPYAEPYTGLDYWIETISLSQALIWIKVPEIPTAGTSIYMYYGDHTATAKSNPAGVLSFYDDFNDNQLDSAKWSMGFGGEPSSPSGIYEQDQKMEIMVKSSSWIWSQEYIVSQDSFEFPAIFNTSEDSSSGTFLKSQSDLYICPTRIIQGDPAEEANWIRIHAPGDDTVVLQRRVNSGNIEDLSLEYDYRPTIYSLELTNDTAYLYQDRELLWNGSHGLNFSSGYTYLSASTKHPVNTFTWLYDDVWISRTTIPKPVASLQLTSSEIEGVICDYWIDEGKWRQGELEESTVWIEVPAIPSKSTQVVYMYYGNEAATPLSDIHTVFDIYDDFDNETLGGDWTWWNEPNENGGTWAEIVTQEQDEDNDNDGFAGHIRIVSEEGTDFKENLHNGNAIYQGLTLGDFEIEAKLSASPWTNDQQAEIIVMEDEDNFLRVGYGQRANKKGVAISNEQDGSYTDVGRVTDVSSPKTLKVIRSGDTWEAWYTDTNTPWTKTAEWFQPLSNALNLGIGVTDGNSQTNYPAEFDYVTVRKYTFPEPTGEVVRSYEFGLVPGDARYDADDDSLEEPAAFNSLSDFSQQHCADVSEADNDRASHGNRQFTTSARHDGDDANIEPPTEFDTFVEFSQEEYNAISYSNDTWATHGSSGVGNKMQHVFQFNVTNQGESVTGIDVTWEGHVAPGAPDQEGIVIWNNITSSWEILGPVLPSVDGEVSGSRTENAADYVDTGNYLYVMAHSTDKHGDGSLSTDYVEVDVVYSDGTVRQFAILGDKVQHVFRFQINENEDSIDKLDVVWEGYCDNAPQYDGLTIWNDNTSQWEVMGNIPVAEGRTSQSYTEAIGNYLDSSGYVYIMAYCEYDSGPATLHTDYVRVAVISKTSLITISGPEEAAPGY